MSDKGKASPSAPSPVRSFDPLRLADLEYRAWTGYYQRRWLRVLAASAGLVRAGFGLGWPQTLYGAWLVLRANQLWAPYPDNDPPGARACMRRFYALIRRAYGEPADPARAAELEIGWWQAHRELQHGAHQHRVTQDPEPQNRASEDQGEAPPAQGGLVAALVRCYAALLAAVHH